MEKLRKNKEFNRIYNKGKKISGKYLLVFEYISMENKIGIVASKKCGNSVYRSRAKRLIREAIRKNLDKFPKNQYIFVMKSIFKDNFENLKCKDIEEDMKSIIRRLRK